MIRVPFNCTGCHACVSVCPNNCIAMVVNEEGFSFPEINTSKCIQCNLCDRICPVTNEQVKSTHTQAYGIKNKNETERRDSSSGGVFSLLAEQILVHGGVVFGAAYNDDFAVQHIAVRDKKDLSRLRNAKYTQSMIGNSFKEIETLLKSGRKVLFSGTPCQCSGLKQFLRKEYDNLLLVDLICHGVPSPKVWQMYINYRSLKENNGKRPVRINMRSKKTGWSHYGYSTEFDYGEGNITHIHNSEDLFMKVFVDNICLRNSCSNCVSKGIERCTDFTLGDYWGVWDQHPQLDDDKGTSIVFVHSEKGKKFLKQLDDKMDCIEVDIEEAYKENASLVISSKIHEKRKEFLEKANTTNFQELVLEYFPPKKIKKMGIFEKVKRKAKVILMRNKRNY